MKTMHHFWLNKQSKFTFVNHNASYDDYKDVKFVFYYFLPGEKLSIFIYKENRNHSLNFIYFN